MFTVRGGVCYVLESATRDPKLRCGGPLIWGITVWGLHCTLVRWYCRTDTPATVEGWLLVVVPLGERDTLLCVGHCAHVQSTTTMIIVAPPAVLLEKHNSS